MSEEKFDVIVVGGGLAGSAAALELARRGFDVLVLERGRTCGSKNISGGRLYGHSLERLVPGFTGEAPLERLVVKERISLLTDASAVTMEYDSERLKDPACASYTVLRTRLDRWLAGKAEAAGAMYVLGTRVDGVLERDGATVGVICGDEHVLADVVILADGVNSLVGQQARLKRELEPRQAALGVKEVFKLDERTISDRFGVRSGEGVAWMLVGHPTDGKIGGGFIYSNRDTISLGVVLSIAEIGVDRLPTSALVGRLENHPAVSPLIAGGKRVEYSAHLVPEGGLEMTPILCGNGVLVTGDAAGFVINLGYQVRGMDLALESGRLAALAVDRARQRNDYSAAGLADYQTLLKDSFVLRDLAKHRGAPAFMENHALFEQLPHMADDAMGSLFAVDGQASPRLTTKLRQAIARNGGLRTLVKTGLKARRAL